VNKLALSLHSELTKLVKPTLSEIEGNNLLREEKICECSFFSTSLYKYHYLGIFGAAVV